MIEIVDAIREVHDTECYGIIYLSVKEYSFAHMMLPVMPHIMLHMIPQMVLHIQSHIK